MIRLAATLRAAWQHAAGRIHNGACPCQWSNAFDDEEDA